jgi:serine-type D-Ala-D-Ala carboxypeptidase/endopeptidase
MRKHLASITALVLCTIPAFAMSESDLRAALEQRFKGDRTGACIAAAVIENGTTASAYVCADAKSERPFDERTAFEIGSVSKTMTAALLAEFTERGEIRPSFWPVRAIIETPPPQARGTGTLRPRSTSSIAAPARAQT